MKPYLAAFILLLCAMAPPLLADNLTATLIIVGPGDLMYTYWGHIGIAMNNQDTGESRFYDFGNFSFHSDNFYKDFLMGRMLYRGNEILTEFFINESLNDDRDFVLYPLNMEQKELKELDARLRWWVLPENREYLYDYFLNNCSTIIRDILDEIVHGQFKSATEPITHRTYRHYARTGAAPSIAWEILLHFFLGPANDKIINGWELMFLPQVLADYGQELEYTDGNGLKRVLVGEPIVLKESTRKPVPLEPRNLVPGMLLAGLAAAAVWCFAGRGKYALIGKIYRTALTLVIGSLGAVLGFLMVFTDHASAYGNINIWLAFPTVLLGLIPIWGAGGRQRELCLSWIWTVNLMGVILAMFLAFSQLRPQQAASFWVFFGPLSLMASRPGLWIQDRLEAKFSWN